MSTWQISGLEHLVYGGASIVNKLVRYISFLSPRALSRDITADFRVDLNSIVT